MTIFLCIMWTWTAYLFISWIQSLADERYDRYNDYSDYSDYCSHFDDTNEDEDENYRNPDFYYPEDHKNIDEDKDADKDKRSP